MLLATTPKIKEENKKKVTMAPSAKDELHEKKETTFKSKGIPHVAHQDEPTPCTDSV